MQNVDYGGFYISGCANLNFHGPATLTYATAALGFTQVSPCMLRPHRYTSPYAVRAVHKQ